MEFLLFVIVINRDDVYRWHRRMQCALPRQRAFAATTTESSTVELNEEAPTTEQSGVPDMAPNNDRDRWCLQSAVQRLRDLLRLEDLEVIPNQLPVRIQ